MSEELVEVAETDHDPTDPTPEYDFKTWWENLPDGERKELEVQLLQCRREAEENAKVGH